eukprot:4211088-Prymnesium_polylepis.1
MARVPDARTTRAGSHAAITHKAGAGTARGSVMRGTGMGGAGAARPGRAARRGVLTRGRRACACACACARVPLDALVRRYSGTTLPWGASSTRYGVALRGLERNTCRYRSRPTPFSGMLYGAPTRRASGVTLQYAELSIWHLSAPQSSEPAKRHVIMHERRHRPAYHGNQPRPAMVGERHFAACRQRRLPIVEPAHAVAASGAEAEGKLEADGALADAALA